MEQVLGTMFGAYTPEDFPATQGLSGAKTKAEAEDKKEAKETTETKPKADVKDAKAKADAKDAGKEADSDIDSVIDHLTKIVTIAKNGDDGEISGNKTIIISALSTAEGS
jgi:hypothetical protein